MKAQKAQRNKQKKQRKKQRKAVASLETPGISVHVQRILESFSEGEDFSEMKKAAKCIAEAPVLGEVLLQLYLKVKESQHDEVKAQLREQTIIEQLRLKEIECALLAKRVQDLEAPRDSSDLYYQDDEMPYEVYMDYLFRKRAQSALPL